MEQVNHPKHYNCHPKGIECIEIIRHYTFDIGNAIKYLWRAGLKPEMGKEDAEKEIEDLQKALWYVEDYQKKHDAHGEQSTLVYALLQKLTGYDVDKEILVGYDENIRVAMSCLLAMGLVYQGNVYSEPASMELLRTATDCIHRRIFDIEKNLLHKDVQSMKDILNGYEVEGMHTAKSGGKRETEPDDYDPLNLIIVQGTAYGLTDKVRKKKNGAMYTPCDICELREGCNMKDNDMSICHLHQAATNEYYREIGTAKYAPSFGTIEVVDEMKELEKERRELEEEDKV